MDGTQVLTSTAPSSASTAFTDTGCPRCGTAWGALPSVNTHYLRGVPGASLCQVCRSLRLDLGRSPTRAQLSGVRRSGPAGSGCRTHSLRILPRRTKPTPRFRRPGARGGDRDGDSRGAQRRLALRLERIGFGILESHRASSRAARRRCTGWCSRGGLSGCPTEEPCPAIGSYPDQRGAAVHPRRRGGAGVPCWATS